MKFAWNSDYADEFEHLVDLRVVPLGLGRLRAVAWSAWRRQRHPVKVAERHVIGKGKPILYVKETVAALFGRAFGKTTGAQIPVDGENERVI